MRQQLLGPVTDLTHRLTQRFPAETCFAALWAMALTYRVQPARDRLRIRRRNGNGHGNGHAVDSGLPRDFTATLQFSTRDRKNQVWARFEDGRMRPGWGATPAPDVTVFFRNQQFMLEFFSRAGASKTFDALLDNDISIEGNLIVLARFGQLSAALGRTAPDPRPPRKPWPTDGGGRWQDLRVHAAGEPCPDPATSGADYLADPNLADLTLDDFPRLKRLLHRHLHTRPRICTERARLYTEGFVAEKAKDAPPVLRQARVFNHVMRNKRAWVAEDDLLLGTTTGQLVGVQVFPELGGTAIWPELLTVQARDLNPYEISAEDARLLDREVFPHWIDDNIREWARAEFHNPESLRLDERWVLYFMWKNHAVSHTIVDVPNLLARGLGATVEDARRHRAEAAEADRPFYQALELAVTGVIDYAERLATAADADAARTADPERAAELRELARICRKVPRGPADTLHEALSAIWICFLSLHQENMNAGLSIGRLDMWLQPYLARDLEAVPPEQRPDAIRRALEQIGAFMLKCTDHLPLVADAGNRLFAGSSSDQVITLGGLRPDGESAVCDATYLFLKATEMLGLRDPNVNARYSPDKNPELYLRRLCEVNLITGATPSIHNDAAMVPALVEQGFAIEDARDWGATGCVEPTSCGRHMGHTNCMMFNMVAPLEMALRRGLHPLIEEQIGPDTGDLADFASYDDFLAAYKTQLGWLIDKSVEANNLLGRSHQAMHPTPYLSSLIQGPMESARDVIDGGARYNSSGAAMVGLSDVVDSLAAVKTLVFERKRTTLPELLAALDADFVGHEKLHTEILRKVPKFGADAASALPATIAGDLIDFVYDRFQSHQNYRGGRYLPGYWSMSNHVAFGVLSGALPSGRKKGKPFTPGITPSPLAEADLLENIREIATLDSLKFPNNIAFNVKIAPGGDDTHSQKVDRMLAYTKSYIELGGMQLQFNVVSTATLRDAMAHPDQYRSLLVRISGYNAYFVELNRDMQLELVERLEHH